MFSPWRSANRRKSDNLSERTGVALAEKERDRTVSYGQMESAEAASTSCCHAPKRKSFSILSFRSTASSSSSSFSVPGACSTTTNTATTTTTPNPQTSATSTVSKHPTPPTHKEAYRKRRRHRRLKQIEERQKKEQNLKAKTMASAPGKRVFDLPQCVRPLSLFIRMGSLQSDQDSIPFEYYTLSSAEEDISESKTSSHTNATIDINAGAGTSGSISTLHPGAVQVLSILKPDPKISRPPTQSDEQPVEDHQRDGEAVHKRVPKFDRKHEEGEEPTQSLKRPENKTTQSRRTASLEQISVFQEAYPSIRSVREPGKRPRSLRILDPRDQKTYEAVSPREFLEELKREKAQMQRALSRLSLTSSNPEMGEEERLYTRRRTTIRTVALSDIPPSSLSLSLPPLPSPSPSDSSHPKAQTRPRSRSHTNLHASSIRGGIDSNGGGNGIAVIESSTSDTPASQSNRDPSPAIVDAAFDTGSNADSESAGTGIISDDTTFLVPPQPRSKSKANYNVAMMARVYEPTCSIDSDLSGYEADYEDRRPLRKIGTVAK